MKDKTISFNTYGKLFVVKREWAEIQIQKLGFDSMAEFKAMYTYDDVRGWIERAIDQDALISVQKW